MIPPAFSLNADQHCKLALRTRQCVDAILAHEQSVEALRGCQSEILVALTLHKIATKEPKHHLVPPEQLADLLQPLCQAAKAVHEINLRHKETGRIGCTAEQREGLLLLADVLDAMRANLPRRLWLRAYREAYRK